MSSELPVVSGTNVVAALRKVGFRVSRIRGSHHIMTKEGHPFVVSVPIHGARDIPRGTLRAIIRGAGLTPKAFVDLL